LFVVKSFADVQQALNQLFSWKDRLTTSNWDFHGLSITNASPGVNPNDYATLSQIPTLPSSPAAPKKYYTIVFESVGAVTVGSNIAPTFYAGIGRTGTPTQIWMGATIPPTTGPLSMNVNMNGIPLLVNNIVLNPSDPIPVASSTFNIPAQKLGTLMPVIPIVASAGGASLVSIGIVIQLDA
jgi:hypothetical protein